MPNGHSRDYILSIVKGEINVPAAERDRAALALLLDVDEKVESIRTGNPLRIIPRGARLPMLFLSAVWAFWVTLDMLGVPVSIQEILGFIKLIP